MLEAPEGAPRGLKAASQELCRDLEALPEQIEGVAAVYNPLIYAADPWNQYLKLYGGGEKRVLFLGMNPGPWGMAQTGVPFGEIEAVTGWLEISGKVGHPKGEHPKRPVEGFDCRRSEVSGRRLWGLIQRRFGTPKAFFSDHFVANYCPLIFLEESGRNRTPDKLPREVREIIRQACDKHLARVIELTGAGYLIGIGKYAEKALARVVKDMGTAVQGPASVSTATSISTSSRKPIVASILHPSPASPAANRGWEEQAEGQLIELGVW